MKRKGIPKCVIDGWLYGNTSACIMDKFEKFIFHKDYKTKGEGTSAWLKHYYHNDTLHYWNAYSDTVITISNDGNI